MTKIQCDVDIDFPDREAILSKISHVAASHFVKNKLVKHNTGVYFQKIPYNPLTDSASIDFESAENRGYFKIDFLNVSAYNGIKDEAHIERLLAVEPIWELLEEKDICDNLAHVNGYNVLLKELKPRSVEELAMVLALIRPGKKHLTSKCITKGFDSIKNDIWTKPTDGTYIFKKSHAISYAMLIVMQLNLLCETMLEEKKDS